MSTRRARVQYGKASKRVSSRITSEVAQITQTGDEITAADGIHLEPISKDVATGRSASKGGIPGGLKEVPPRRISQRVTKDSSKSSTRRSESKEHTVPAQRKRKRNASPANSDSTDVVEEEAPIPKALKVSGSASPAKKGDSPAITPGKRQTPPRSILPNKPNPPTPKIIRDLSDLFISPHKPATPAMATSPPKPSHLKRMLSKAKTEPALEEPSARVDLFPSKSTVIPSFTPPRDPASSSTTPSNNIPSFNRHPLARGRTPSPTPLQEIRPVSRSPQRPGRTYSKSRSFLVEIPQDGNSMDVDNDVSPSKKATIPEDPDLKDVHRESYSELRSRWGIDNSDHDPTLNMPINDLNSIGEMRSRGETRRFLDEVGYLFDGLDPSNGRGNTGAKRASAIEIVSKMGDPDFSRRAVAANFAGKAWSMLRGVGAGTGDDKILDAALIAFAALSMKDQRHAAELCRAGDLLPFLGLSIGVTLDEDVLIAPPADQELIWTRKLGLSKVDRTSLTVLRTAVSNSLVLPDDQAASHRLLAAQTLSSLLGFGLPLTGDVFDAVLLSLSSELSALPVAQPPPPFDSEPFPDLRYIRMCLKIAEKVVMHHRGSVSAQKELLPLLSRLVNPWPALIGSGVSSSDLDDSAQMALQYLVRVTHDSPRLCDVLVEQPRLMHNLLRLFSRWHRQHFTSESNRAGPIKTAEHEEADEDPADLLTRASLSLGLVTQLVKQGDAAKVALRETRMSSSCSFTGICADECQCEAQLSGVEVLVEVFDGLDEGHDAKADYFKGHIGILLSLLCLHDPQSRSSVLSPMKPEQGSQQEKIQALIATVREFSALLSTVVNAVSKSDSSSDAGRGETAVDDEGMRLAWATIEGLKALLNEEDV